MVRYLNIYYTYIVTPCTRAAFNNNNESRLDDDKCNNLGVS